MPPVDDPSDDSEPPATIKMPDLLQRQKAYSEGLTACLRANGMLQVDEEATVTFDETGRITAIELDGMSAEHAENFVRNLTALKVHDPEKPELIESATFGGLSPVEYLDRERKQREKPNKPRGESSSTKIR
jgi:hypothetical protein